MICESETFIVNFDDSDNECECKYECECDYEEYEEYEEYEDVDDVAQIEDQLSSALSRLSVLNIEDDEDEKEQEEIAQWKKIQEEALDYYDTNKFENYVRWYVSMMQGTIEQPYVLYADNGDILTARSYFKAKENQMVEMRLLFDESQMEKAKEFIIQIGFVFENLNFMFESDVLETSAILGSVMNPYSLFSKNEGEENDMLYAYNDYNASNRRVSEMRLVFSFDQTDSIKKLLKLGGFIVM